MGIGVSRTVQWIVYPPGGLGSIVVAWGSVRLGWTLWPPGNGRLACRESPPDHPAEEDRPDLAEFSVQLGIPFLSSWSSSPRA